MVEEVSRWMNMAEQDYGVSKHLFETYYPKPLEIICYHCQQAAEKAIQYAKEIIAWAETYVKSGGFENKVNNNLIITGR